MSFLRMRPFEHEHAEGSVEDRLDNLPVFMRCDSLTLFAYGSNLVVKVSSFAAFFKSPKETPT